MICDRFRPVSARPSHCPAASARGGAARPLARTLALVAGLVVGAATLATPAQAVDFHGWAPTPPLGWNSWDGFGASINEEQARAQAQFMSDHLEAYGYQYFVIDAEWFDPGATNFEYHPGAALTMDGYGRLLPSPNRFPSAANGVGFRALAAYVHNLGLRFGVHLMRGIPRLAVEKNLPIFGTDLRARDIADPESTCAWNPDMYGVDMSKPGAQAYYDSVFRQFAAWGIDFVKVDDMSRPYREHAREIEAVRRAIDRSGRAMVLSLSPGETPLDAAEHVATQANMWRISDDFWDRWLSLREQFTRLAKWSELRSPGAWPDADMLPLGMIDQGRRATRFTSDEQRTLMTLWSIARSPLIYGGDLVKTDAATLALLTNKEVLAVNQRSTHNRPLWERDDLIAWVADVPESADKYVALFNARGRIWLAPERAAFRSDVVARTPDGSAPLVAIDVDVKGATKLFLAIDPTEDGDAADHALWIEPTLTLADGTERKLTDEKWTHADALWDSASTTKGPDGKPLSHRGRPVAYGLATNGRSVVEYALPAGAVRFRSRGTLNDSAVRETTGGTIRFLVFAARPADEDPAPGTRIKLALSDLGFSGNVRVRDLWAHKNLGIVNGEFAPVVPFHGAGLYRISPRDLDE